MSTKYTKANCHQNVVRIVSIDGQYVAGAVFSPSGMYENAYVLKCVENVVLPRSFSAIRIIQYPELASRVLKTFASQGCRCTRPSWGSSTQHGSLWN